MADYRFSAQAISRGKGQSSIASAAYRSASRLVDEQTGQIHDFSRKGGLVHAEIMTPANTPDWMKDRGQLWNAVEAVERRKDAQLAREIQISLPHELDPQAREDLTRQFVQEQFVDHGMIADIAIHAPGKNGDQRNHHAHIMLTMRDLTADGFGKKNRDWNAPEQLKSWREAWADHQNRALERAGSSGRVDHRSFADRGIDREPTNHLGPTAHSMEQNGKRSRIGDENRAIDERNSDRARNYAADAAATLELDQARGNFSRWADYRRLELEHAQELQNLDLAQKQGRLKSALESQLKDQFGPHRAALSEQINAIDQRLSSKGLRRVFRDVFGRSDRDREERENHLKTLASIEHREKMQRDELGRYLSNQRKQLAKDQARQKKATESRIQKRASWLAKRAQQAPEKTQERSKPSWWDRQAEKQKSAPETPQNASNNNSRPKDRDAGDIKRPNDRDLRDFWNRNNRDPGREPD